MATTASTLTTSPAEFRISRQETIERFTCSKKRAHRSIHRSFFILLTLLSFIAIGTPATTAKAQNIPQAKTKAIPASFRDIYGVWRSEKNHLPSPKSIPYRYDIKKSVLIIQLDGKYTLTEGSKEILKSSFKKKSTTTYEDGDYEFVLSPTKTVLTVKDTNITYVKASTKEIEKYSSSDMTSGHYFCNDSVWIFSKTGVIYRWNLHTAERLSFYSFENGKLTTTTGDKFYFEKTKSVGMTPSKSILIWELPSEPWNHSGVHHTDHHSRIRSSRSASGIKEISLERKGVTTTPVIWKTFISEEKGYFLEIKKQQAKLTTETGEIKNFTYIPLGNIFGQLISEDGEWWMTQYMNDQITINRKNDSIKFKIKK